MLHTVSRWTVLTSAGLAADALVSALGELAVGPVHLRLVLGALGQPCACCLTPPALIVAVSPDDPSLPHGLGRTLRDHGPGVALATADADHLVGTFLVTETMTLPVVRAGSAGGDALVVHFADALPLLVGAPELVTVAVFRRRPGVPLPDSWTVEADDTALVALTLGRRAPVRTAVLA